MEGVIPYSEFKKNIVREISSKNKILSTDRRLFNSIFHEGFLKSLKIKQHNGLKITKYSISANGDPFIQSDFYENKEMIPEDYIVLGCLTPYSFYFIDFTPIYTNSDCDLNKIYYETDATYVEFNDEFMNKLKTVYKDITKYGYGMLKVVHPKEEEEEKKISLSSTIKNKREE